MGFAAVASMRGSKLFDSPNVMAASPVADAGYRATLRGNRVVVPGLLNRIGTTFAILSPRKPLLRIVERIRPRRKVDESCLGQR